MKALRKKITKLFFLLFLFNTSLSQVHVYSNPMENLPVHYKLADGIKGKAMDLTAASSFRQPLSENDSFPVAAGNFTISLWVKAPLSAKEGYTILHCTSSSTEEKQILSIGMQPGGSWFFRVCAVSKKDSIAYDYKPVLPYQLINDNKWHFLGITCDSIKKEFALYYDGYNKALIHTPGLLPLQLKDISIGGLMEGVDGQWETFNGYIDEVNVFDRIILASQFYKEYLRQMPHAIHKPAVLSTKTFSVMNFNILHGGHETGKETGVQRIVDVIKSSGADIISMQETYGSGPAIADALGFYFYLRSTNLAVFSRFPIESSLPAGRAFNSGGVLIDIPGSKQVAFYTNWLNYPFDYWDLLEKGMEIDSASWYQRQDTVNAEMLRYTLKCISPFINSSKNIPVIFCGDLNTGSHLDWIEATRHLNNGHVMPFPATRLMEKEGFIDSYRFLHPDPLKERGTTWSPFFPGAFKDRIDYIYYKPTGLKPVKSKTISWHPVRYPSDHAAVVTKFIILK
jgi:endonuclease/exonuclease/phosphatase family metal-dependent hydrolase